MFKRIKWASKVLFSHNFLVMTDSDAVINFEGKPPFTFEDNMELAQQAAALEVFREQLEDLSRQHDEVVGTVMGFVYEEDDESTISEKEIQQASKSKKRKSK